MILKYNNNLYKYVEDKDIWLIGTYSTGYTWFNYEDEEILTRVFYCGELINKENV